MGTYFSRGLKHMKDIIHFSKKTDNSFIQETALFNQIDFKTLYSPEPNCIETNTISPNFLEITKSNKQCSFYTTLLNRKTDRNFSKSIDKETFFQILHGSVSSNYEGHCAFPSAGAKYSVSLLINVNKVNGFSSGLYYYDYLKNDYFMLKKRLRFINLANFC